MASQFRQPEHAADRHSVTITSTKTAGALSADYLESVAAMRRCRRWRVRNPFACARALEVDLSRFISAVPVVPVDMPDPPSAGS